MIARAVTAVLIVFLSGVTLWATTGLFDVASFVAGCLGVLLALFVDRDGEPL